MHQRYPCLRPKANRHTVVIALAILVTCTACVAQSAGNIQLWIEHEVWFESNGHQLFGVLCLPPSDGPHSAVVLIAGSVNSTSSFLDGAYAPAHVQHAHRLAAQGTATLRFDPAGVGQSEGSSVFGGLDQRMLEALAALEFAQSQPSILAEQVGLWGISQGGWVIAMAAAERPDDVAFLIMVSGTTISVAEQQVYGVEMQARAAGLSEDDVRKATVVNQLLVDWQITEPLFMEACDEAMAALGPGPWQDLHALVHTPNTLTAAEQLAEVIELLESIQDETWAQSLYLRDIYLPSLRSTPPEQAGMSAAAMEASLLASPAEYFTQISCPMLALFGEDDVHLPAQRSAELLREYFAIGENDDLAIVIFEDTGHSMNDFMPAYWDQMHVWLDGIQESW